MKLNRAKTFIIYIMYIVHEPCRVPSAELNPELPLQVLYLFFFSFPTSLLRKKIHKKSQKRLNNTHNVDKTMNIHVTNSINCRREHQVQVVTRTKRHGFSNPLTQTRRKKTSTNGWVVDSKLP